MKILIFIPFFFSFSIFAEYRAYQYLVEPKNIGQFSGDAFIDISSLDPQSYYAYHGGSNSIKITMLRTWMCEGSTANQMNSENPICDGAYDQFFPKYLEQLKKEIEK